MQKKQSTSAMMEYFLKYAQDLTPEVLNNNRNVRILTVQQIDKAAQEIKNNRLVGFPTETVYGLGANATDQKAILSIYEAKKRPLSDPIIVHILNVEMAYKLVDLDEDEKKVFDVLTKQFWPGPLTFIAKANLDKLPLVVTAGTGFVGLRSPKHPVARKLIQQSGLPIGAPSANLFGHVSPTQSFHVVNDFYNQHISVIDGGRCQFGLQSTVVKFSNNSLQVLRQGSLTTFKIEQAIKSNNLNIKVQIIKITKDETQNQQSPGQLLKHYSPNIPCYYYSPQRQQKSNIIYSLPNSVFLSFSSSFDYLKDKVGDYFTVGSSTLPQLPLLSQQQQQQKFCTKQQKKIMQEVYYLLRKAQNLGKQVIIIGWQGDKKGSIWDKISRATQNKSATIINNQIII